jgi:hypothetical protein
MKDMFIVCSIKYQLNSPLKKLAIAWKSSLKKLATFSQNPSSKPSSSALSLIAVEISSN